MKYAKFSDAFLSDFRLDDNGETLVLTDKRGYTRAIKLLPYEERPIGEWIFDSEFTEFGNPYGTYRCSICGCHSSNKYSFCKDCGADMRGEEDEKA